MMPRAAGVGVVSSRLDRAAPTTIISPGRKRLIRSKVEAIGGAGQQERLAMAQWQSGEREPAFSRRRLTCRMWTGKSLNSDQSVNPDEGREKGSEKRETFWLLTQ